MVAGGRPARKRVVLSLSVGGAVVGSAVLGASTCCTPPVPPDAPTVPPPAPTVVVDASPDGPATGTDGSSPDVAEKCDFTTPRTRSGRRRAPRIVGGEPSEPGAFPAVVAIATPARFQYCGGVVAGPRAVRTAAHCMPDVGDVVLVGSNDLREARSVRIVESRINPKYDPTTFDHDAATVIVAENLGVPSIPLADGITTNNALVLGWGRTEEGGNTTNLLQEVHVPIWEQEDCEEVYGPLTNRQVCAGAPEGGKDACQADSGSGLLVWNVGKWEQLGIVSFGIGCARPSIPGVFADVRDEGLRRWLEACSSS